MRPSNGNRRLKKALVVCLGIALLIVSVAFFVNSLINPFIRISNATLKNISLGGIRVDNSDRWYSIAPLIYLDGSKLVIYKPVYPYDVLGTITLPEKPKSFRYFTWQLEYGAAEWETDFLFTGNEMLRCLRIDEKSWSAQQKWATKIEDENIVYAQNILADFKDQNEILLQSDDKKHLSFYDYSGRLLKTKILDEPIYFTECHGVQGSYLIETRRWKKIDLGKQLDPKKVIFYSYNEVYDGSSLLTVDYYNEKYEKIMDIPDLIAFEMYPIQLTKKDGTYFKNRTTGNLEILSTNQCFMQLDMSVGESSENCIRLFSSQLDNSVELMILKSDIFDILDMDFDIPYSRIFMFENAPGKLIDCYGGIKKLYVTTDRGLFEYDISAVF